MSAPTPDEVPTETAEPSAVALSSAASTAAAASAGAALSAAAAAGGAPDFEAAAGAARARTPVRRAPLALAASVTTAWAALVSLGPVLVVVFLAQLVSGAHASVDTVFQIALAGWLLAHGVDLRTAIGPLGLAPLALTALAAWRVARAGVHTTRAIGGRRRGSLRVAVIAAAGVAVAYGLFGAAAAVLASMPGLTVPVWPAALTLGVFGFVAALCGATVESGAHVRLARRTPTPVRDGMRTGLVAALLVLGAGAAAAGTSLALSGGAASKVLAAYHAGVAGQVGLTLLCVVYGPNLAIWAASYLIGPGFALGTGTTVSAGYVSLGTVPALPVLAAVPTKPISGWGGLLLVVPLAAGMAAGWLLARRSLRADGSQRATGAQRERVDAPAGQPVGWGSLVTGAALAGPVAGAALALAAWASAGPLGGGRLAEVGPSVWPLAGIAAGLVAVGAVVAAVATKALIGVRRRGV
ncbi:hypothetical protein HC028_10050 [Planosporangium flavigriseum]|uniref:Integral membrane protein n=1 Tax=Planosporangium flavigriseum TaxID=373681 RepID=A0A8J3LG40_9ACTN|nr:DUF6350 family protein [Planosporangium flavigriseum]NJC64841.1 hypothetical protein [Planosporangium flavigriseum]GIG72713.1 hypothetical protein Pfl04_11170 [Planosporangium flavigriseum]